MNRSGHAGDEQMLERLHTTTGLMSPLASSQQAGFSLTEVMTVVAIFLALGLTAMPVFSEIQQQYNLHGAVRRVYGQIQKARMAAVTRNTRYLATVSSDGLVLLQEYDVDTGMWQDRSTSSTNDTPGIYVTGTSEIAFCPDGTATSTALFTVLNSAGMQRRIVVNHSGSIEIL